MTKYFGTDGIRDKADIFSLEFVQAIACGLYDYAKDQQREKFKVLLSGDTRESTGWILRNFESAFEALGIEFGNAGVLPTPAINFVFYEMGFDYAIDVTASHNPFEYNGVKIFERGEKYGVKLSPEGQTVIENAIDEQKRCAVVAPELREDLHEDALDRYLQHLRSYIGETKLNGLNIGLDCANGATSVIADKIFTEFGANVTVINCDDRYGRLINNQCGSTNLNTLGQLVRERNLDFGIAFDGDGDRCLFVDQNGSIVDGDHILAIFADFFNLPNFVTTVMANQGLIDWAKIRKIHVEITDVGEHNVIKIMHSQNINLGGEQNGHIIIPNEPMEDGMLTGLIMAKIVANSNSSLAELATIIKKLPEITLGVEASKEEKKLLESNEEIKKLLKDYESIINSLGGRMLVRPSGTEDVIRITMWGKDEEEITAMAQELANRIGIIIDNSANKAVTLEEL